MKAKAEAFSKEYGLPEWSCSSAWLSRWKVCHNISYRCISGENASVNKEACEEWKQLTLLPILCKYDPNDVLTLTKQGSFFFLLASNYGTTLCKCYMLWVLLFINPRRACAARVTVLGSCVCVCLSAPFRPLRVKVSPKNDTNASSRQDKENILFKMLRSKVMASFAHFVGVLVWLFSSS